ncbi:hypothetical protein LINGRAHAP2_LOCUS24528 [Linum grandiflorum]
MSSPLHQLISKLFSASFALLQHSKPDSLSPKIRFTNLNQNSNNSTLIYIIHHSLS